MERVDLVPQHALGLAEHQRERLAVDQDQESVRPRRFSDEHPLEVAQGGAGVKREDPGSRPPKIIVSFPPVCTGRPLPLRAFSSLPDTLISTPSSRLRSPPLSPYPFFIFPFCSYSQASSAVCKTASLVFCALRFSLAGLALIEALNTASSQVFETSSCFGPPSHVKTCEGCAKELRPFWEEGYKGLSGCVILILLKSAGSF